MTDERITDLAQGLANGRLNRRQLVRRAAALGISASAIGAVPTRRAAAAPGTTRAGRTRFQTDAKTLVIADALAAEWITLDPAVFYEINSAAGMSVVWETLYHMPDATKPDQIEPLLAEALPEMSADGLAATIKLRAGVKFHNSGNEMTADDWIFSWNRLRNKKGNGAFLFDYYLSTVEAVDPLMLKIGLTRPIAPLVPLLSSLPFAVSDSKVLRENGGTDAADAADTDTGQAWFDAGNSAGTGPFKLTAWDINTEVVVERHEEYWGEAPAVDRIIWRNIADANSQLQAVERGEADIAYALDPDAAASVQDNPELQLLTGPTLGHQYLALNTKQDVGGPLANAQLRQAIGYATDYEGIINQLLGGSAEVPGPATIIPLPLIGTPEAQSFAYKQDLAKAQELFDASGVGEVELTFSFGAEQVGQGGLDIPTLAQKLQSDWQQINGLTIKLNPLDTPTRLQQYREGKLQFTISGWTPDYPDSDTYALPFGHSGDVGTAARRVGYGNPEVDAMIDSALSELDVAARTQAYVDIQRRLVDDAPFLVLYQPIDRKPASAKVQGVAIHSVYQLQLRNASKTE